MGMLIDGEWSDRWYDTASSGGEFRRGVATFRNWITADGSPGPSGVGGFPAESGRYHLYVSYACPWAHRTLILRALRGLTDHIGLSVVHPDMLADGWSFATDFADTSGDGLYGLPFLRDLYRMADPKVTTRVTVPVLWDSQRRMLVSNESSEIIRMFDRAFDGLTGNRETIAPPGDPAEAEALNSRIYDTVNNGVYKAGFATSQAAYDAAVAPLFDTLDWLDRRLAERRFLLGDRPTEPDWRLFPTLVRFDAVYHGHFKCNRRRLIDYANLWPYARDLYQWPGIADTIRPAHYIRHYHASHPTINPHGIIPIGPRIDWTEPAGRA